jgi:hypothetical protein
MIRGVRYVRHARGFAAIARTEHESSVTANNPDRHKEHSIGTGLWSV